MLAVTFVAVRLERECPRNGNAGRRSARRRFAFFGRREAGQERVQIRDGSVVILCLLINKRALRECGWHLRIIRERFQEVTEGIDDRERALQLHATPTKLVGRFCAQLWRELGGAQLFVDRGRVGKVPLFVEGLRLQEFRLIGPLRGGIGGEELVHRGHERRRIRIVDVDQPLVIKGAGAGADITASGVFADIIRTGRI